ncbi:MAG: choice-of-anchor tandem repeat GloVer-containing protein [Limisphaerales bacterium]
MTRRTLSLVRNLTTTFATALLLFAAASASAQTFTVLYNFSGGADGGNPGSTLAIDTSGNLYGAAFTGGLGYGTAFELSPSASGWTFNTLYSFQGFPANDGAGPVGILIGPEGALLGTTQGGGKKCKGVAIYDGCGTVYELTPPPTRTERVLYRFTGGSDGILPYGLQPLALHDGTLYGTAFLGGAYGECISNYKCGASFQLTPPTGTGTWHETVTWDFGSGSDGAELASSVIFDNAGNMYGTTIAGGDGTACFVQGHTGCGIVYELSPSSSGWTETTLYNFLGESDGGAPYPGLVFDSAGNLYGATAYGGSGGGGTIYELSPSSGGWIHSVLYSFAATGAGPNGQCYNCPGPYATLIIDGSGNLYGTTYNDGVYGRGMVFELAHSGAGWTFTDLHDFTGGSDGADVWAGLVRDRNGDLYGATHDGGANGYGVVYEIAP